jgi:hypothetical protein
MNIESISSKNLSKELAYLLGVYLTDGSITHPSDKWATYSSFSLKTIDREFAEFSLECFKKIKPDCKANVFIQQPITRYWNDGRVSKTQIQYCIGIGITHTQIDIFFETQTNKKHHIPFVIWDAPLVIKKWFIAGVMDGNGWISKTERKQYPNPGIFQYRIGICGISEGWIYEFEKLLQQMGVKTCKIMIDKKLPRNIPIASFSIKTESFISHGLFFTIQRKQKRIKEYILKNVQRLNAANPTGLRNSPISYENMS